RINEGARKLELDKVIGVCSNPDQVPCATWARTVDGHAIVTGSTDGKLRMRSPENRTCNLEINAHSDRICAVVPSPDKRVLASASYDHTLRVLDLKAKSLMIGPPLEHSAELSCAAFAAGGTLLAAGTWDGMIYVWEISDLLMEKVTNVHDTDADKKGAPDATTPLPGVNVRSLGVDSTIPTRAFARHKPARRGSPRYGNDFWGTREVARYKARISQEPLIMIMNFLSAWIFSVLPKKWSRKSQAESETPELANPSIDVDNERLVDLTTNVVKESNYPIAQGSICDVWKCQYNGQDDSIEVAVKSVRIEIPNDHFKGIVNKVGRYDLEHVEVLVMIRDHFQRLMDDFSRWKQLKHDHILPLCGITYGFGPVPAMVYPWMHNGTLSTYLDKHHDNLTQIHKFDLVSPPCKYCITTHRSHDSLLM
ncbi:hypothetical protein AZE42_09199, partial [Rhizopogon vesiculosus]